MIFAPAVAILAAIGSSSVSALPLKKRAVLNDLDFQIVNLALNLENLELNLWGRALANFTAQDFTDAGAPEGFYAGLELLRNQETAHVALLEEVLEAPFVNCTYDFPIYRAADVLSFGQIVTSVGEGAYLGALGNITSPAVRQSAGQIIGNEARQNSYLRSSEKLNFFNAPNFDTPLTARQAYSLAAPYWNCPVGNNPAFNFTEIPALNLTFVETNGTVLSNATIDNQPGALIKVTWNATQAFLGADVHLIFLSDVHSVVAPLNQTTVAQNGTGSGTTFLPPLINGTTFVIATTFNGSGPIPDALNYAIGPLVVA